MSAEESKAVMRRFWELWEQANIDLLDELLAPDYINHTLASPDLPPGPEGVKEVVSRSPTSIGPYCASTLQYTFPTRATGSLWLTAGFLSSTIAGR